MRTLALTLSLLGLAGPIYGTTTSSQTAAVTVSMAGDDDCFGLGGSCPDGTLWRNQLGGVFGASYQQGNDPDFTDAWGSFVDPTYQHSYSMPVNPISATLSVRFAGIGDVAGPWYVFYNTVYLGSIPINGLLNASQMVKTYSWNVPVDLLTGNDTVLLKINSPWILDGYAIDYARLTITSDAAVPEPTTMLLAGPMLLLALKRRHRRWTAFSRSRFWKAVAAHIGVRHNTRKLMNLLC